MKDRRSFYRNYPTIFFTKGETIFYQHEMPKNIYCIKSGIIESTNITSGGECQTISFETVGDIVPKCWAFSKTNKTLFYYTAHTDCELYVINKKIFSLHLVNDVDFANKMLNRTMSSLVGARLKIDALGKPSASVKLLYIFRYLSLIYGNKYLKKFSKIQLPLTQQTISNIAGLTRETTSREIKKMKNNKILICKSKLYIVDTEKLNDCIEDEYDPGIEPDMLRNVTRDREG